MAKKSHKVGDWQPPTAERSAVGGDGGLWRRLSCRRVLATFQSPVPAHGKASRKSDGTGTRDWKVPRTRRLKNLRYGVWPPCAMEWPFLPPGNTIVVSRAKSNQIAFGARPSRPQQRDFEPCHCASGRSATSRRRFPLRRPIQPNRAKSCLIVLNPDKSNDRKPVRTAVCPKLGRG